MGAGPVCSRQRGVQGLPRPAPETRRLAAEAGAPSSRGTKPPPGGGSLGRKIPGVGNGPTGRRATAGASRGPPPLRVVGCRSPHHGGTNGGGTTPPYRSSWRLHLLAALTVAKMLSHFRAEDSSFAQPTPAWPLPPGVPHAWSATWLLARRAVAAAVVGGPVCATHRRARLAVLCGVGSDDVRSRGTTIPALGWGILPTRGRAGSSGTVLRSGAPQQPAGAAGT